MGHSDRRRDRPVLVLPGTPRRNWQPDLCPKDGASHFWLMDGRGVEADGTCQKCGEERHFTGGIEYLNRDWKGGVFVDRED